MEETRIPKRLLYMNLGKTRLRGKTRNRCQDKVSDDLNLVVGKGWQERDIQQRGME